MSSREITQLHTELGCFRGGTLKHTSYSHPGWELDPNNVLEVTSSLDSLFLQVVHEQFVHEQDPPQLQVPPGKQTKSINQSVCWWQIATANSKMRNIERTLTLGAVARVHSSGAVACLRVALLCRWIRRVCVVDREDGRRFYSVPRQQNRVQTERVTQRACTQ